MEKIFEKISEESLSVDEEYILGYLTTIPLKARASTELAAYRALAASYSGSQIASALNYVRKNGLPPYGKVTLDPLVDLLSDDAAMKLLAKL